MPRILLDGEEFTPRIALDTWGGVLQELDGALAPGGRIVTDVRFDGVDEAAFRDPRVIDRPLRDLATLEVVSGTPGMLMNRCLDEALAAIPPFCEAARGIGAQYRAGDIRGGADRLADLATGLASLVEIVAAVGPARRVGLLSLQCEESSASELLDALGGHLQALVSAHEAADWITVANALEREVEPSLRRLAPILESLLAEDATPASRDEPVSAGHQP